MAAAVTAEDRRYRGKVARLAQLRVFKLRKTLSVPVNGVVGILERLLGVKATKVVAPMSRNADALFTLGKEELDKSA